jgi:D-beta-D-heptose 7-phosphate kinase/D-beta-D-heptose 1-phosphate adenosyltransferase
MTKKNSAQRNVKKKIEKREPVVVAVSGGFDPIHVGHVRMFEEAKKLGDKLVVILNNDHWLRKKKMHIFMPDHERKELIKAIGVVDEVVLTGHGPNPEDMSVCETLRVVRPHVFANGGDRKPDGDPVPEVSVCDELGIQMVYNIGDGGKMQSSSWLLKNYVEAVTNGNGHKKANSKTKR